MAEKRMFTKKVTDDDNFMALSSSAQALYLHLSMSADDDGFCNQISVSMFKAHASVQDLQALLEKRYLYQFENGVIVIKHWRMANALRKDRYKPTSFQEQLQQLGVKENGSYTLLGDGCTNGNHCLPQYSIDKYSIDNNTVPPKLGETTPKPKKPSSPSLGRPSLEEVVEYVASRGNKINAEKFFYHYEANGWVQGKGKPIKNWKACVITWENRQNDGQENAFKFKTKEPEWMNRSEDEKKKINSKKLTKEEEAEAKELAKKLLG